MTDRQHIIWMSDRQHIIWMTDRQGVRVMVFNATFNNISAISCIVAVSFIVGANHQPAASHRHIDKLYIDT
jgi:hypothetical protein